MEIRDMEIFLALAEELHFGRTAERLHVSQARISQAIKKQERALGAPLFERTSRRVRLTTLGQQLYTDLRRVHGDLRQSLDRARQAAEGGLTTLRLGMIGWNSPDLQPLFDTFTARHPECDVQIRHLDFGDPFGPLRAGQMDVAIAWLPVREPDLHVGPVVLTEPLVLAVSATHPLAREDTVSYEDLADHLVVGGAEPPAHRREAIIPRRTPSGRDIPIGPVVTNFEQMVPILVRGAAVGVVHAHARRYAAIAGIAYVPIRDAPPSHWALIWRAADDNAYVHGLAAVAREHGTVDMTTTSWPPTTPGSA